MKRSTVVNLALTIGAVALVAAGMLVLRTTATADTAPPRTVKASTGTVQSTVTASGNANVPSQLNLGFPSGGKLVELDVAVGAHVSKGDVLAKLDDTNAKANLASAQANLASAQGKLQQLQQGLTPQEQSQNDAAATAAQVSVNSARQAQADATALASSNASSYQSAIDQARQQLLADEQKLTADEAHASSSSSSGGGTDPISADQQTIQKDQTSLTSAQNAQITGLAKDKQTLDQAQSALDNAIAGQQKTTADNAAKAQPPKPGDLATAQAGVTTAQSSVDTAQKALDDLTLQAPADGTVASVNGLVGEQVGGGGGAGGSSAGGGASASSGGANAAGGAGGASGGSSGGSSSTSGSGSSSSFLVLTDLGALTVQAGFPESDAVKVKPGQSATVTFDALGTQPLPGKVASVDPTSTIVSNVVTYNVTVALDRGADGLRPGMTGNVSIVVGEKDDVVRVPAAAVQGAGNNAIVMKLVDGKQVATPVTIGLRGTDNVEVSSGVADGDDVVIPTASSTNAATAANGNGQRPGGAGGFGGGGGGAGARGGGR